MIVSLVVCSLCSPVRVDGGDIRVRTASSLNLEIARKVIQRLSKENPKLAARIDLNVCPPGFSHLAEGNCEILIIDRFPKRGTRNLQSLPAGTYLKEKIAAQQRVLVVVNKANKITQISHS